jgi:hypothetical protein
MRNAKLTKRTVGKYDLPNKWTMDAYLVAMDPPTTRQYPWTDSITPIAKTRILSR